MQHPGNVQSIVIWGWLKSTLPVALTRSADDELPESVAITTWTSRRT
jgi:hypothetical protein